VLLYRVRWFGGVSDSLASNQIRVGGYVLLANAIEEAVGPVRSL